MNLLQFDCKLIKSETRATSGEDQKLELRFEHVCELGGSQEFLNPVADKLPPDESRALKASFSSCPTPWRSVIIPVGRKYTAEWCGVETITFEVVVTEVKCRRTWSKGKDVYTYTIVMVKDKEKDTDDLIDYHLGRSETSAATGKNTKVSYSMFLEDNGSTAESVPE